MDDADIANNDVVVAPRLQRIPGSSKGHRKARERRQGTGRLRLPHPRVGRPGLLPTGLAVLAVLLAAAAVFLGWSLHNDSDAAAQRGAARTLTEVLIRRLPARQMVEIAQTLNNRTITVKSWGTGGAGRKSGLRALVRRPGPGLGSGAVSNDE